MRARQWMQIAAVASAVGLTGSAIAHDIDRTSTSTDDTSASVNANPAAQLGGDATNPSRSAVPDNAVTTPGYDTATPSTGGDASTAIDGASNLSGSAPTTDDSATGTTQGGTGYLTPQQMQEFSVVTPGEGAAPPRTGSDVQPGDMGPGSARGE